jgi:hypothetical protein
LVETALTQSLPMKRHGHDAIDRNSIERNARRTQRT